MSKAKINFLFAAPEPLPNGKYRLQVIAFNANDRKLAESGSDIKSADKINDSVKKRSGD